MQPVYIVMICAAALFALLLLAYFKHAENAKKLNERKEEELQKVYSDKNLAKMEYDVAVYDEETRKLLSPHADSQVTMDEVIEKDDGKEEEKPSAGEILFGKVDDEGMEEITGNFKGD
ncbi:MAG TPA: hypothetical protein IAC67_05195 [Candidatus Coproplasma excrementipullorum]|mgnify:CR=1 FL=1|nr:hypothetical protein [Candidatus Coproplasma excrementipullorum]